MSTENQGGKYVNREKFFFIHENVQQAYLNYKGDNKEFVKQMREGKDGHNDEYDETMRTVAEERTDNWVVQGGKFPIKKKK
jgi:hypothetical protein